jgi:hypothetical protein
MKVLTIRYGLDPKFKLRQSTSNQSRIKRSADPAWNSESMASENQCGIGVAALPDPCYSLKLVS